MLRAPVTWRSPMILQSAGPGDLAALMALERSGFPAAEQWSEQSYRAELEADDRFTVTAHHPGSGLVGAATFRIVQDETELFRVLVAPEHRDRGVARALLRAGVEWARACGARRMLLEVSEENTAALPSTGDQFRTSYCAVTATALVACHRDGARSQEDTPMTEQTAG